MRRSLIAMNLLQFVCAICVLGFVVIAAAAPNDGVVFPDHRRTKSHEGSTKSYEGASKNHDMATRSREGSCGSHCARPNAIPVSLAKQLSAIDSSEQFLRQFVENGGDVAMAEGLHANGISLKAPFAQSTDATKRLPPATCKPELRTISLMENKDPTLIYYPMCVRLEQCGGCCNHELLECQPTKTSPVNVTLMMTNYVGNKTLKFIGKKTITLLKHEACSCDCKSKPKDCRGRQVYRKNECRCACVDEDEERECSEQPDKLWDSSTCQCTCREVQECSSGYVFDSSSCRCAKAQEWANYNSYRFRGRI